MIDRATLNRALAKALAYKQAGDDAKAAAWAVRLVRMLGVAGILDDAWTDWSGVSDDLEEGR